MPPLAAALCVKCAKNSSGGAWELPPFFVRLALRVLPAFVRVGERRREKMRGDRRGGD
jgi:hypothetical protein